MSQDHNTTQTKVQSESGEKNGRLGAISFGTDAISIVPAVPGMQCFLSLGPWRLRWCESGRLAGWGMQSWEVIWEALFPIHSSNMENPPRCYGRWAREKASNMGNEATVGDEVVVKGSRKLIIGGRIKSVQSRAGNRLNSNLSSLACHLINPHIKATTVGLHFSTKKLRPAWGFFSLPDSFVGCPLRGASSISKDAARITQWCSGDVLLSTWVVDFGP